MRIYHDEDADLAVLQDRTITVVGYGNQGRAQALNLRDSGMAVIIGNREDNYADRATQDGFEVLPIPQAVARGDIVMLLIPDEVMPAVFEAAIMPTLRDKVTLVFASGYNVAFDQLVLPAFADVVLLAPRMIGEGVRDLFAAGDGFPSFVAIQQDVSGRAHETVLALAKGIGSTRKGVVQVTFPQEAELDLFTEQCFGPAFGAVLTSAVTLLVDEGYPPEAVLLELYMSGEFAYTLGRIAEMGTVAQTTLHSTTSQYGSMSRGIRFQLPEIRKKMRQGLDEIRSGTFAREWAAEQAEGTPTLAMLREAAQEMPLHEMESALREALSPREHRLGLATPEHTPSDSDGGYPPQRLTQPRKHGLLRRLRMRLTGFLHRRAAAHREHTAAPDKNNTLPDTPVNDAQLRATISAFLHAATADAALQAFSRGRDLTMYYVIQDRGLAFTLGFHDGTVTGSLSAPSQPAEVQLTLSAATLDGMLSGVLNPTRAALSGDIVFGGDTRQALTIQRVQKELMRLYRTARADIVRAE